MGRQCLTTRMSVPLSPGCGALCSKRPHLRHPARRHLLLLVLLLPRLPLRQVGLHVSRHSMRRGVVSCCPCKHEAHGEPPDDDLMLSGGIHGLGTCLLG